MLLLLLQAHMNWPLFILEGKEQPLETFQTAHMNLRQQAEPWWNRALSHSGE